MIYQNQSDIVQLFIKLGIFFNSCKISKLKSLLKTDSKTDHSKYTQIFTFNVQIPQKICS